MAGLRDTAGRAFRRFTTSDFSGAGMLVLATAIALVWANFGGSSYDDFWHTEIALEIGGMALELDLLHWINDGAMALFFLMVSLEVKHDLTMGELHDNTQARLPIFAAIAGLVVPAAIFVLINWSGPGTMAWGVVISTDTAFMLGFLALFGSAIPAPLRAFILTLAVIDDIGALAVVALVYTEQLAMTPLIIALLMGGLIYLVQRFQVWHGSIYLALGIITWLAVYASGVHATIAGVLVGLLLPVYPPQQGLVREAESLTHSFRRTPNARTGRAAAAGITRSISINERLQRMLSSWVTLMIVPIFALANAGVEINAETLSEAAGSTLFWAIIAGLVVGKFTGIVGITMFAARMGWGQLSPGLGNRHVAGGAMLTGIGFTISLFIVDLALPQPDLQSQARIGVLTASLLAGILGVSVLAFVTRYDRAHAPERMRLVRPVVPRDDHLLGRHDAPLQLVEYGRFGGTDDDVTADIIEDLRDRFDEDLVYVFRHNPLDDPVAEQASEAVEAVGHQAPWLFWNMRRELVRISADEELDIQEIRRAAVIVGANLTRMEDAVRRGVFSNRVNRDALDAETMHLTTTPRFFINGVIYEGPVDYDALAAALESARENADANGNGNGNGNANGTANQSAR